MNNLIELGGDGLLALFHGKNGESLIPKPFERDIFLKIGYIPQKDNIIFARLMDAGKLLFGKITEKEKKGNWLRIKIQVFMHE